MLMAAIKNYIYYFGKFIKCFFIILLSIFIFYFIFELAITLPFQNMELNSYEIFIEEIQEYISNVDTSLIFNTGFLSDILLDLYHMVDLNSGDLTLSTVLIVISLTIVISGFGIAQWDCRKKIRDDYRLETTPIVIVQNVLKCSLSLIFSLLFLIVSLYWFWTIFLLPVVYVLFTSIRHLISTWFNYFRTNKFREIVNFKNAMKLVLIHTIFIYLHSVILIYLFKHLSLYLILLLTLTSLSYITVIMEYTATSYFFKKRDEEIINNY